MKLHKLKRTSDFEIKKWLKDTLELSPYQIDKLYRSEIIRGSKFYFFEKRQKTKVSFLWRLSFIPYLLWVGLLFIGFPFTIYFTGEWGYGNKLYDVHSKWRNKLKL